MTRLEWVLSLGALWLRGWGGGEGAVSSGMMRVAELRRVPGGGRLWSEGYGGVVPVDGVEAGGVSAVGWWAAADRDRAYHGPGRLAVGGSGAVVQVVGVA